MQTECRERQIERWYDSQWSFFWTIVGAMMTAGAIASVVGWVLMILATNYTLKSFDRVMSRSLPPVPTMQERPPITSKAATRPELRQRVETINHPPKSKEECLKKNWGVIDETFERCRAGWVEKRATTEVVNEMNK